MLIQTLIENFKDGCILFQLRRVTNVAYRNIVEKSKLQYWSEETKQEALEGLEDLRKTADEMIGFIEEDVDNLNNMEETFKEEVEEGDFDSFFGWFEKQYYRFFIFVVSKIYMRHYTILTDEVVPKMNALLIKFRWSMMK